jgi:hypothetical protein
MRFPRRLKDEPPAQRLRCGTRKLGLDEPPPEPWMDRTFVVNDKPTNLRTIRRFAMDMAERDYMTPTEAGLAMTIVALVDEVSYLHAQLLDARRDDEPAT